ncbi:DNA repair protein RAD16-like [Daucus carota subsp. sativus]|uniref:DNA repair protein RAD16-like n=1 Tax=Daucus carota subsp. sativus TaxID=79200 RepID=UPI003082D89E
MGMGKTVQAIALVLAKQEVQEVGDGGLCGMEKNNSENTVSRRRVVPIKINSIFIDFSSYQMKQVGGHNHNNLPSRNDSGQFEKSGEDGAGIKANENSVEHSSGKKAKGRDDVKNVKEACAIDTKKAVYSETREGHRKKAKKNGENPEEGVDEVQEIEDEEIPYLHLEAGGANSIVGRSGITRKSKKNLTKNDNATSIELQKALPTVNDVLAETAEPPPSLIMPLLRYQKEWLAWALKQEESAARAGILADEMGMGKTAQAIALVMAKKELEGAGDGAFSQTSSSSGLPKVKATLVICPMITVMQWANEISGFTLAGRKTRKYVLLEKQRCTGCGELFDEGILAYHRAFVCVPRNDSRTNKQHKQRKSNNRGVDVTESVYDGKSAFGAGSSTNDSEGAEKRPRQRNYNLYSVDSNRIILDEAHHIKDHRNSTSNAVLSINSTYKWALSGTPLPTKDKAFIGAVKQRKSKNAGVDVPESVDEYGKLGKKNM